MARSPTSSGKPVHVPGQSAEMSAGLSEARAPFIFDPATAKNRMPMFAPVTGPRLTPEEAPGKPADWVPHRPDRPDGRKHIPFRLHSEYTPAGDQPAAIA